MEQNKQVIETIQKMIARIVATSPVGYKLCLIGGFRYRLLDRSVRMSTDIDYHWEEDFGNKQNELIAVLQRKLIPEIKRQLGYDGNALVATGLEADSPAVRIINLAFWKPDVPYSRIEIPVEITRIICHDKMIVRTAEGVVYPTASDADMIESKVIGVFNRRIFQHRDLLDIFLFAGQLISESPVRIMKKLNQSGIKKKDVQNCLEDLAKNSDYHLKSINQILESQFEPESAANLKAAGGGEMILKEVVRILHAQADNYLKEQQ